MCVCVEGRKSKEGDEKFFFFTFTDFFIWANGLMSFKKLGR